MGVLVKPLRRISQLQIDANKDWNNKGISNIAGIASGSIIGSIFQFDGTKLITLIPTSHVGHVLTSNGPGKLISWAPGGTYLNRYFPVVINLSFGSAIFVPDKSVSESQSGDLTTLIIVDYADPANPRYDLVLGNTVVATGTWSPDFDNSESAAVTLGQILQKWESQGWLDTAGVFSDNTAAQSSGLVKDQANTLRGTQDQSQTSQNNGYTSDSVNWNSQTFIPANSGYLTKINLQLYKVGAPITTGTICIYTADSNGKPTGIPLGSTTFSVAGLGASPGSVASYVFANPAWVYAGIKYCIVVYDNAAGGTLDLGWRYNTSGGSVPNKAIYRSADTGATWANPSAAYCFYFVTFMNDSDNGSNAASGANWEAQTFTPGTTGMIRRVILKGYFSGDAGQVTVSIRATAAGLPTGADLCSTSWIWRDRASLDNYYGLVLMSAPASGQYSSYLVVDFIVPAILNAGTVYAILIRTSGSAWNWRADTTAPYVSGQRCFSINSGASWTADATDDAIFEEYYALNDVALLPAVLNINDALYWGFDSVFDGVLQDIQVAGTGTYTLVFEYSQAAGWNACVGLVDNTTSFKTQGIGLITHTIQGDFDAQVVNGVNKFWIRARVTNAGAGYGQPLGAFAKIQTGL